MKFKKELLLIYHLAAILLLVALHIVMITGGLAHEIMGLVFIVVVTLHIIFCRKGYGAIFKSLKGKPSPRQIAKFTALLVVVLLLVLQIVSGLIISEHIFSGNITPQAHQLHIWSARINAVLIVLFIVLNFKELVAFFSKLQQEPPDNSKDDNDK